MPKDDKNIPAKDYIDKKSEPKPEKHPVHKVKVKGKLINVALPPKYPKEKLPHLIKFIEEYPEKESPPPEAMVTKPQEIAPEAKPKKK